MSTPAPAEQSAQGTGGLNRRTLVRTAAWSVPAITLASATPAFAASTLSCTTTNHTIAWSTSLWNPNRSNQSASSGTIDATALTNAPAVTLTVSRQFSGNMVASSQGQLQNMQISPSSVGGTGARSLTLIQQQTSANSTPSGTQNPHDHRQTVTFSFSKPVKNLRFTITDIDNNWNGTNNNRQRQYRDYVYVSGNPTATTALLGAGAQTDPWHRAPALGQIDNSTSSAGNVALQYDSTPLNTVSVTYYNAYNRPLVSNGQHAIWISGMTFDVETCS